MYPPYQQKDALSRAIGASRRLVEGGRVREDKCLTHTYRELHDLLARYSGGRGEHDGLTLGVPTVEETRVALQAHRAALVACEDMEAVRALFRMPREKFADHLAWVPFSALSGRVGDALDVKSESVAGWEHGRRRPQRIILLAYEHLRGVAQREDPYAGW